MLVAIVMCASVLAVCTFADIGDTEPMKSYAPYFPYYHGSEGGVIAGLWGGYRADSFDFTTLVNSELDAGPGYGAFAPSTSANTFAMTFYGDSFGTSGNDINGFAYVGQGDWTASQMKGVVSFYVNNTVGVYNSWKKVEVASVEIESTNGFPVYVFWFTEVYKADGLLIHFSSAYDSSSFNIGMKSQVSGNDWCRACYDPSKIGSTTPTEEPPTGEEEKPTAQRTLFSAGRHTAYACNITLGDDGKFTTVNDNWHWTDNSGGAQWFWDGQNHYNPFVGYDSAVTANEIVIGDVSHWDGRQIGSNLFTDYSKFQLFVTDDPNGAWTKVDFKGETYNCDQELNGTYQQGIRLILKKAVTAKYFLIYYPDSAQNELWTSAATMTAAYNPAYASADTGDMLSISIAVASVAILGTAAAIVMKKRKED